MSCWPNGVPTTMPAQDRGDIIETYARYAWGIDLADEEMVISAFAEDGAFDHLWQGRAVGHAAILENLRELWLDRQHWWLGRQHLFDHYIMTPTEDGATVRCFFQILQFNTEYKTNFVFGIGTRVDQLVKRDGRWLFKELFVNAWRSLADVPWKGELRLVDNRASPPSHPDQAKA
ncbi:nuclear transport factor 2 family protein [Sphingosinicella sp. CPCC 101087]|uniref:nuclear transport factor 2 family protein n=1 Tax=Sphingosinicella sp. CPCC 101087 TaxID=2497754 RepID=UPI00101B7E14|nr:nuclear transport factor 2 family protein [Sphingosinicella sp. CPCC 101087]